MRAVYGHHRNLVLEMNSLKLSLSILKRMSSQRQTIRSIASLEISLDMHSARSKGWTFVWGFLDLGRTESIKEASWESREIPRYMSSSRFQKMGQGLNGTSSNLKDTWMLVHSGNSCWISFLILSSPCLTSLRALICAQLAISKVYSFLFSTSSILLASSIMSSKSSLVSSIKALWSTVMSRVRRKCSESTHTPIMVFKFTTKGERLMIQEIRSILTFSMLLSPARTNML